MRRSRPKGQSVLLVLVALSMFVIGAMGLALDGSHLYAHRQMAQAAADAAAAAAIRSIFTGTNTAAYNNLFGAADFNCAAGSTLTPCFFAGRNGFDAANGDTIEVSFPTVVPGVELSDQFDPAAVRVRILRTVDTTLVRFVGPAVASVAAEAIGAIRTEIGPVPILVLHPTLPESFRRGGSSNIKICGGPSHSIQVNSVAASALEDNGNGGNVDLSKAGPDASGPFACDGTGGDFGVLGGPNPYPGPLLLGTSGEFRQPYGPVRDPLANVDDPLEPGLAPPKIPVPPGLLGCPAVPLKPCNLYFKGSYPNSLGKLEVKNETALFTPGVYYVTAQGFKTAANGHMRMAQCPAPDPDGGGPLPAVGADPDTGCGMVVYNTGNGGPDVFEVASSNSSAILLGAPNSSKYKGILLFQYREAASHTHRLGGGGDLTLTGTIYITNWELCPSANPNCPSMFKFPTTYQELLLRGNAGNTTQIFGEIIVGTLDTGGNSSITMTLDPNYIVPVNRIALVR